MFQIALAESTAALRRFPFTCTLADHITPANGLTFSAGEIKISKTGAAEANHAGTVTEIGGGDYYYEPSSAEVDTQGFLNFRTGGDTLKPAIDFVHVQIQIGPFGSAATLNLKQLSVVNSAGSAIVASSTGSNGHGVAASGNGSGEGLSAIGGATGHGIEAIGGSASGSGMSISAAAGSTHGLQVSGFLAGSGIKATGGVTGHGLDVQGGSTSGDGLHATAPTAGDGIEAVGAGGGFDLNADVQGSLSGSIGSLGATAKTDVNTEVDTALADINLNDLIQITGNVNDAAASTTVFIGNAGLSATNDFYNGHSLTFTSGTQAGLSRRISDYVGATKTITLGSALPSAPANGVTFSIVGLEIATSGTGPTAAEVADAVWDELRADHVGAGSLGEGVASVQGNVTGTVAGSVASVVGAVGSVAAGGITAPSFGAGAMDAAALAADAGAEIAAAVWNAARGSFVTAGSFGQSSQLLRANTATAGAAGTITLDASASAVDDFYNNTILQIIGGTGVGQSRIISDYVGATKVATVNGNWITNPDNTSVFVILPFGSIPGASAPTAADVADAVWDESRSTHVSAGSFGQGVASVQGNVTGTVASVVGNLGGSIGSLSTQAKADVNTEADAALVDINLDHLVKIAVDTNFATTVHLDSVLGQIADAGTTATFDRTTDSLEALTLQSFPSLAAIVDGVWDELRADHILNGSFGQGAASVQGNVSGSVGSVTGAVGSVTGNVGGNVVGSVASVAGSVAGSVTGSVGSVLGSVAGNVTGTVASVVGNVGGNVVGSVGSVAGNIAGNLVGSIGSLATQAKADVNFEVADVLKVDALTELSTLPPATPSFLQAIMFLYQDERNLSLQTATLKSITDSAGAVIAHSNLSDDTVTLSKSQYIAGP